MGQLATRSSDSTALATYGGVNPWAEAARGVETGAYLKFNGNTGEITFGSDDEELPVGSQLVVDMQSLAFGWICWVDSQVEEELLVPVIDGKPPMEHELKDHGPYNDDDDGWREAASFSAVLLEYGEDAQHESVGTKLLFKTSTGGPVRSTKKLSGQYGKLFMQHPDELPVVEVSTESYIPRVKKHGKKWSLIFKIVGWIGEDELAGLTEGAGDDERDYEPEPAPVEKPAARRQRAPEPEPEEEPAPAPARRGRAAPEPEPEAVDEDEDVAPAPRGRSPQRNRQPEPEPAEAEEDAAPAPRSRRQAAPEPEPEEEAAPAPRGRAAAGNARVRRFA